VTTVLDGRSTEPFTLAAQPPRADRVFRVDRAVIFVPAAVPGFDPDVATAPWPEQLSR